MRRLLLALIACAAWPLRAQMDMQHSMKMNEGPLGIPESRMGSGTSWLPDASPMHAAHMVLGDWTLMLHGKALLNTTGREAHAAAISWASLIGRWPLQAARWAAAGSSSAAC